MQEIVMPFDSKLVEVVKDDQGVPWVSVRSICNNIGVDSPTQVEKLKKDVRFNRWDMPSTGSDGKQYRMFCIPLEQINGWLFSINPNKVPDTVRPKLIAYQQECFQVLYKHFMPRGEMDLKPLMERFDKLDAKLDELNCVKETVFGNDEPEITDLVKQVSEKYKVDGRTVWGWIQTDCDVGSYKKQNLKIKNYLKKKLGIGLQLVDK
jgi:hypothetical protein